MIQFGYTILYVRDVEKTMAFYEKAFGLQRKFIAPGNVYGEMTTGATTLSFAELELAKSNLKNDVIAADLEKAPFAIEIGFTTDDVKKVYDTAISAGATPVAHPQFKPHGQTVAYVRDLDGFLVEICTPMG
jgi:lactoylglutathione lyase